MSRSTYKALRAIQWLGSAAILALVVAIWMKLLPAGLIFAAFILVGSPTALASWVLRDQRLEELPE